MANRFNLKQIIPGTHQIFIKLSQAVANTEIDKLHQRLDAPVTFDVSRQ